MKLSVLLTCHNRKAKTEICLQSLQRSLDIYNNTSKNKIQIEIYLTDDGCSDGTSNIAREVFPDSKVLHVLQGDGNLYWAGGMRFCWRKAMERHLEWDYYLLLNDDAELMPNVWYEMFQAEHFAVENYGKEGIVSGITCSKDNENTITYGGSVWASRIFAIPKLLSPTGSPQLCELTNANILLVPRNVVDSIGILYEKYRHGKADFDYSVMARRAGYPVVVTANFCGFCERDHLDNHDKAEKIKAMSLKERKAFFSNPIHSNSDYMLFIRRTSPIRMPLVWIGRMLNLYFPTLYYRIK